MNLDDHDKKLLSNIRIVLLNGPPGSGKDSGGAYLARRYGGHLMKFAEPLKRSVFVDVGLPYDTPLDAFDAVKEEPLDIFGGRSFRRSCIEKSENWIKQIYGEEAFGKMFLRRLLPLAQEHPDAIVFVTDSGFPVESQPLVRNIPIENFVLFHIYATGRGKSYAGDSRNYWTLPGIATFQVMNGREGEEGFNHYCQQLERVIDEKFFSASVLNTCTP